MDRDLWPLLMAAAVAQSWGEWRLAHALRDEYLCRVFVRQPLSVKRARLAGTPEWDALEEIFGGSGRA